MRNAVTVFEVGPRDGLQNEPQEISTQDKVKLIDLLSQTGLDKIEAASFVSPRWVPQMADGADVMQLIQRVKNVQYSALAPNMQGFENAIDANVDAIAIFASASESFSEKNINCSIEQSLKRFEAIASRAAQINMPLRGYVSCVTHCPYEGRIDPQNVKTVSQALLDMGCYEVSLGDTIGHAKPDDICTLLDHLENIGPIAGHFHDTKGFAIENVKAALNYGVRVFDSSIGGAGGCPFAPGAKGNLSTTSLVRFLHEQGFETGLNIASLETAENFINKILGKAANGF